MIAGAVAVILHAARIIFLNHAAASCGVGAQASVGQVVGLSASRQGTRLNAIMRVLLIAWFGVLLVLARLGVVLLVAWFGVVPVMALVACIRPSNMVVAVIAVLTGNRGSDNGKGCGADDEVACALVSGLRLRCGYTCDCERQGDDGGNEFA